MRNEQTINGKIYISITEPGTKKRLRSHYEQLRGTGAWLENKDGTYEVGILKEEYDRIENKFRKHTRKIRLHNRKLIDLKCAWCERDFRGVREKICKSCKSKVNSRMMLADKGRMKGGGRRLGR